MQASLQKLQDLLQKLFRADAADLDFGIYRIINYRRDQIQKFIDEELPTIVQNALETNTEAESAHEHLTELENQVRELGTNLGEEMLDADGNFINYERFRFEHVQMDTFVISRTSLSDLIGRYPNEDRNSFAEKWHILFRTDNPAYLEPIFQEQDLPPV